MQITKEHFDTLRQCPLFSALNDAQLEQLQSSLSMSVLSSGEHLFEQGDSAKAFYLLLKGQVRLYRLSPAGQEKVIEIIRPGHTFAEALMFLDIPSYPVNAQALSDAELYVIKNRAFIDILRGSVDLCFNVMVDISMRLKRHLNEIDALTLQNATLRVVNYLSYMIPKCSAEAVQITLPAAKNVVASRLSITPETFSRILHTLSSKGLITVDGLQIQVHDVEQLRAYGS